MRISWLALVLSFTWLTLLAPSGLASAQPPTQSLKITPDEFDYTARELGAPSPVMQKLELMRRNIGEKKLRFQVGYTSALDYSLEQITGLRPPPNLLQAIQLQNQKVKPKLRLRLSAADSSVCSPTASSFDWRNNNGVTPVRDQGGCGSCWAFTTHAAFEGSARRESDVSLDTAEQDTLSCSGEGTCAGGWWAFDYLIGSGTTDETALPYSASDAACPDLTRQYKSADWGYVSNSAIPDQDSLKAALCQYGPLAVAVEVTPPFQAYTGGVFDQSGNGTVNHAVTLVGWNDADDAWIIKNSWGAGWGETSGVGTERGYMRIGYGTSQIGYGAAWVVPEDVSDGGAAEYCDPISPTNAALQQNGPSWKIVDGERELIDFGGQVGEAWQALAIIKHYRIDQFCAAVETDPSFEYARVGLGIPEGGLGGEDCIRMDTANLEVKQIDGRWKIVDNSQWLYDFDDNEAEARTTMGILQSQKPLRQCYVGRPGPSFKYLRK